VNEREVMFVAYESVNRWIRLMSSGVTHNPGAVRPQLVGAIKQLEAWAQRLRALTD
jgi:hypothetical protein